MRSSSVLRRVLLALLVLLPSTLALLPLPASQGATTVDPGCFGVVGIVLAVAASGGTGGTGGTGGNEFTGSGFGRGRVFFLDDLTAAVGGGGKTGRGSGSGR